VSSGGAMHNVIICRINIMLYILAHIGVVQIFIVYILLFY